MPALNRFMWLGLCLCVTGAWCSTADAQTPTQTKRYPSEKASTVQRTAQREPVDDDVPVNPGRARLNGPAKAPVNGAASRVPGQQQARPIGQPLRIRKVSPEMDEILQEWERKSSTVKRLEGTFKRTTYDSVFEVEQVSEGKYCFAHPDKGSFQQTGLDKKIVDRMISRRLNTKGKPFTVQPGDPERWVCTGEYIFKIDDKEKTFEKIIIPEADRGQNIKNAPLPFVFGMKADEAKQRYDFELDTENTNGQRIRLKVRPLLQQDLANYKEAEVILNRETCLPIAVKMTDPTGNKSDVYSFQKETMVVNKAGWSRWLVGDPLNPSFKDLKERIVSAPGDDRGVGPAAVDRRIAPAHAIGPKPLAPSRTAELPGDDEPPPARRTTSKTTRPRID